MNWGRKMSERIIGIEIGSSTIKMIEVIKNIGTLEIQRFSLIDTPVDCMQNGVIHKLNTIKSVLLKELQAKKYKGKKVAIVVQSSDIIIRNMLIGQKTEKLLMGEIASQMEKDLPVRKEHYQIDYKIIGEVKEGEDLKNEMLLVAAPNKVIFPIMDLMKSIKKIPVIITIPSEALNFVFASEACLMPKEKGNLLVLDIGGKSTVITVIAKGQVAVTRTINFGVDDINAVIETQVIHSLEQDNSIHIEELIRLQVEEHIAEAVERVLQFYERNFEGSHISRIYLIGGGANIKGIREDISEAVHIPAMKVNIISGVVEKKEIGFSPYKHFFINLLGAINGL